MILSRLIILFMLVPFLVVANEYDLAVSNESKIREGIIERLKSREQFVIDNTMICEVFTSKSDLHSSCLKYGCGAGNNMDNHRCEINRSNLETLALSIEFKILAEKGRDYPFEDLFKDFRLKVCGFDFNQTRSPISNNANYEYCLTKEVQWQRKKVANELYISTR